MIARLRESGASRPRIGQSRLLWAYPQRWARDQKRWRGPGRIGMNAIAATQAAKRRVVDFFSYGEFLFGGPNEYFGTGVLGVQEEVRSCDRATSLHVREAVAGALRLEARGGHADAGKPESASAKPVAL